MAVRCLLTEYSIRSGCWATKSCRNSKNSQFAPYSPLWVPLAPVDADRPPGCVGPGGERGQGHKISEVQTHDDAPPGRTWMRRKFGLIPRDESFFELFAQQATVLRECLPIVAAMRKADVVDSDWATAMQAIEQRADQLAS